MNVKLIDDQIVHEKGGPIESRRDARAITIAIQNHVDAIEGYSTDHSVTDEVFKDEALGRIHLIQARLARLREALEEMDA